MRGIHSNLIVTQTEDDATGESKPLFAFPVQICKAVENEEVRFDRAAPSGAKVQQVYRDTVTGELLETGDLIRGIRTGDSFQQIPDEQIKAIDEQLASKDIVVERSIDLSEVPFDRVTGSYYLQVPAKNGSAKYYRLLYESLNGRLKKQQPRALRVSFVSRTRQKLGVIYADPKAQCLVLLTLTFAEAVRKPDEQVLSHLNAEVSKEAIDKARAVIDALDNDEAGDWDAPVDQTIVRRRELVDAALAGEGIEAPTAPAEVDVNDEVESMLEASLAAV